MFAGRVPFAAESGIVVLHQQIYDAPPPLRSLRWDIPRNVESAVGRMLAKRADRRFPSAQAFVAAMAGDAQPGPWPATGTGPHPQINALSRRSPRWLVPAVIGMVGVGLLASLLLLAPREPEKTSVQTTTEPQAEAVAAAVTAVVPTSLPTPIRLATATVAPTPTARPSATPVPSPTVERLPSLASYDFTPKSALSGESITLRYEIASDADSPIQVVLGASIRPSGGGGAIDDSPDDKTVTVQPGRGVYQRVFHLPDTVRAGRYDVLWGLIGMAQQSLDLQVQSNVLEVTAPTPTRAPARVTSPQVAPAAPSPADAVQQYYVLIGAGEYQSARALQSPRLQGSVSYTSWSAGLANTRSVKVSSVRVVTQSATAATVSVAFATLDIDASGHSIGKTFQGTWELVPAGAGWKLDTANLKQIQ
jgi:hypothetical protein